ncbi:MAG: xanthine dehydrogenase molybdopterin binding subunit [Colwellia sp.]
MRHLDIPNNKTQGCVGKSVFHDSAIKQVCGQANYIDDHLELSNCLYAYPILATITCGKIISIDCSTAQAIEGIEAIISSDDIPGKKDIGPVFPGDVLLAEQQIEYHNQPVLLVVATSYKLARKAARLINIEYQESSAVLDIHDAIKQQHWVRPPHQMLKGNAQQAIKQAQHTLSGNLSIGGQEHFYLEGQVASAQPTEDGGMFIQCSTQHPSEVQHLVAKVLNRPFNVVTVEMRRMGGAFGGKETQAAPWACLAALAAHHTACPVKIRLARSDDFRLTGKRHPFYNKYQIGFDHEGVIAGVDIEVNGDCGYSPDLSDAIVDRAMFHVDNAYYYANTKVIGNRCKTNTVSHTAFRGFGGPQGMIMAELIMDDIARYLDKDPLTIRKANLYSPEKNTTHYKQKVEQHVIGGMIKQLENSAQYWQRRAAIKNFNEQSPFIKKGLAMTPVKFGISFTVQHLNQAGALLNIYSDGSIQINHGGTEMGQGLNTKVAQIVAHAFSVDFNTIAITATNTDKVPNTSPTAASSGTDLNGMAALNAANTLKARLINFISIHFKISPEQITFTDNHIQYGKELISFVDLIHLAYTHSISLSTTGYYSTPKIHYDRSKAQGHPFFYYANGVSISEVEIDTLTGENTVTRVDILQDVGNSLNPALDIGQIEGGFTQGMGWLTTEDLQWDNKGRLASFAPANYKIPAIGDTPDEFNISLYDSANSEATIFRSKAVGEPPFMLGMSVWCAIRDAIASINDYQFSPPLNTPATPERVLETVMQAKLFASKNNVNKTEIS